MTSVHLKTIKAGKSYSGDVALGLAIILTAILATGA